MTEPYRLLTYPPVTVGTRHFVSSRICDSWIAHDPQHVSYRTFAGRPAGSAAWMRCGFPTTPFQKS